MEKVEVVETIEIPLAELEIGKGQARIRKPQVAVKDLAASIEKVGLLEPIMVGPKGKNGKYEILLGQRRFLAHVELGYDSIRSQVLSKKVNEIDAKVISFTENEMRRDVSRADKIDVCTYLFKKYEAMTTVAEETGLPYHEVKKYVRYDQLPPELKELVDSDEVNIDAALKAHEAAEVMDKYDVEAARELAFEMAGMSGAQQGKLLEAVKEAPGKDVADVIETSKEQVQVTQVVMTVTRQTDEALNKFADEEGAKKGDAAAEIVRSSLIERGYEA